MAPPVLDLIRAKLYTLQYLHDRGYGLSEDEDSLRVGFEEASDTFASNLQERDVYQQLEELHTRPPTTSDECSERVKAAIDALTKANSDVTDKLTQYLIAVLAMYHDMDETLDTLSEGKDPRKNQLPGSEKYITQLAESLSLRIDSGQLVDQESSYYERENGNILIVFMNGALDASRYKAILERISASEIYRCDIISEKINAGVAKDLKKPGKYKFRHFKYSELQYNPTKHMLVPKCTALSPEDAEEVFSQLEVPAKLAFYNYKSSGAEGEPTVVTTTGETKTMATVTDSDSVRVSDNPHLKFTIPNCIEYSDPISKWYDFQVGQLIEEEYLIFQYDDAFKTTLGYRVVIPDIPDDIKSKEIVDKTVQKDAEFSVNGDVLSEFDIDMYVPAEEPAVEVVDE